MTDLENTLRDAFRLAQNSRREAGLAPREMEVRKRRDGSKQYGPTSYKMTIWLNPWRYADLMHARAVARRPVSANKFLQELIDGAVPRVATRPPPKAKKEKGGGGTVVPLRRKRVEVRARSLGSAETVRAAAK